MKICGILRFSAESAPPTCCTSQAKRNQQNLVDLSLLISEDVWLLSIFPAIAVSSAHLLEGIKTLQSLKKGRKPLKSLLISKEKVYKETSKISEKQRIWLC